MQKPETDIDREALRSELAEFCDLYTPSQCMHRINEIEQEHMHEILSSYRGFIIQFEAGYELLLQLLDHVNYGTERIKWPAHRVPQNVITVMNTKPIYSAYDRFIRGYYEDSLTLARVAYEAFFRIVYLSLFPDAPAYGFYHKPGTRKFNLTNFIQQDLRLDWGHYRVLSAMAHSYQYSVLKEMVDISKAGQFVRISASFEYDQPKLEICMNILQFLIYAYYRVTTELLLIPHSQNALNANLLQDALHYIDLEKQVVSVHPTEAWNTVCTDIDDIFEIVRSAEAGEDWTSVRNTLRPKLVS